tara:strand:- start:15017 stop:15277 length:261 start_codon:yes stop_codon:yes gene_type:complete
MSDRDRITKSVSNALYELIRADMLDGHGSFDEVMAAYMVRILDNFDERLGKKAPHWVPDQLQLLIKNLNWIRLERSVQIDNENPAV